MCNTDLDDLVANVHAPRGLRADDTFHVIISLVENESGTEHIFDETFNAAQVGCAIGDTQCSPEFGVPLSLPAQTPHVWNTRVIVNDVSDAQAIGRASGSYFVPEGGWPERKTYQLACATWAIGGNPCEEFTGLEIIDFCESCDVPVLCGPWEGQRRF